MGLETQIQEWSEITVNSELPEERFEIPEEIREQAQAQVHAERVLVKPTKLAEGVYFGEGLSTNNMWVEFEDFVLVVEGPGSEQHSLEVLRQILETVGDKPIRYLVTTHHHADHIGGIRTYAAAGATVLTHVKNEKIIWETLTGPHTLRPDRLAESGQEPRMETVEDRRIISDGKRRVELVPMPNPHADGYLAVYLPRERLIFESDLFHTFQNQTSPTRIDDESQEFYEAVQRAGLRVDRVVPGHGRLLEWQELVEAYQAGN